MSTAPPPEILPTAPMTSTMITPIVHFHLTTLFDSQPSALRTNHANSPSRENCIRYSRQRDILQNKVTQLVKDTNIPPPLVFVAMFYLTRFRNEFSLEVRITHADQFELLVVSLLLSCKMNEDDKYTNEVWSVASGIPLKELNALEMKFLECIGWRLFVHEDLYAQMTRHLET